MARENLATRLHIDDGWCYFTAAHVMNRLLHIDDIEEGVCYCWACTSKRKEHPTWFVACSKCGNKRCPHTNNHLFKCTNSNEPDQNPSLEDV